MSRFFNFDERETGFRDPEMRRRTVHERQRLVAETLVTEAVLEFGLRILLRPTGGRKRPPQTRSLPVPRPAQVIRETLQHGGKSLPAAEAQTAAVRGMALSGHALAGCRGPEGAHGYPAGVPPPPGRIRRGGPPARGTREIARHVPSAGGMDLGHGRQRRCETT